MKRGTLAEWVEVDEKVEVEEKGKGEGESQ